MIAMVVMAQRRTLRTNGGSLSISSVGESERGRYRTSHQKRPRPSAVKGVVEIRAPREEPERQRHPVSHRQYALRGLENAAADRKWRFGFERSGFALLRLGLGPARCRAFEARRLSRGPCSSIRRWPLR